LLQAGRPDLPALFISGYPANVLAEHGAPVNGVEFLQKPFTGERLLRRVREVLERKTSAVQ
jgi:FixJ family two-component response regulator